MHILGKVLAVLVVIAAIAASVLTSKLILVRNSWTGKSVTARTKLTKTLPNISELEIKIDTLKGDYARARELWGEFWNNVETTVTNTTDGTIEIAIGTTPAETNPVWTTPGVRQGMVLHGFELAEDGTSTYRGSFLTFDAQATSATLKPNWRATPNEVKAWQSGKWRWRNAIPSGYQENFDKQLQKLLMHEETLNARVRALKGQEDLLAKANANLKLRIAELVGGEGLEKGAGVDPEFQDGLVTTIEQTEEERNQTLIVVDELRRKVRNIQADIERLQAENAELAERLPEPRPAAQITQKKNGDRPINE